MKHLLRYGILSTAFFLSLFTACEKEEEVIVDESPKHSYFIGKINDNPVNVAPAARGEEILITSITKYQGKTIGYNFAVSLKDYGYGQLLAHLAPILCTGVHDISPVDALGYDPFVPYVALKIGNTTYQPYKKPFRIIITTLDEEGWSLPCIIGEMNGTLYNPKNMNDSIVFKNIRYRITDR